MAAHDRYAQCCSFYRGKIPASIAHASHCQHILCDCHPGGTDHGFQVYAWNRNQHCQRAHGCPAAGFLPAGHRLEEGNVSSLEQLGALAGRIPRTPRAAGGATVMASHECQHCCYLSHRHLRSHHRDSADSGCADCEPCTGRRIQ